jgi:sugar phosphate isomerase/epimerase
LKLGLGTYIFRWGIGTRDFTPRTPLGPIDLIWKCVQFGVDLLQYADNMPLQDLSGDQLAGIRRAAEAGGVELEVGTRAYRFDLNHLYKYLEIAERLGARLLRLVLDSSLDTDIVFGENLVYLRRALPEFRRAGVSIALENFLVLSPKLIEFVEVLDDPLVGICLDTANTIGEQEWPMATIKALAPYAINIHLKDCKIVPGPRGIGYLIVGMPWGEGIQNPKEVMAAIRSAGKQPNLILEHWMLFAAGEEETLRQETEWIGRSVQSARAMMAE